MNSAEFPRQHVSTRVMKPLWLELRWTCGEEAADQLVREAGLSPVGPPCATVDYRRGQS